MNYYDSNRDPANSNAIAGAFYWMSLGSTGTTTASATTTFDNLVISSSPNFPPDGSTMTRYFVDLPGEPYYTDIVAGNSTFVIRNINTSTVLTRVPPGTALSANTYKIFDESQQRRGCLEVHVGLGSNQPADRLAFHGRFIASMLGSTHFQRIEDYFTSKDKIVGITMANSTADSDHDIDFGSGYVYNETETRRLTFSAMTKRFDSTFTVGTSAGILVDTTAISANADYYIYAIGKNNYSSAADYVASTNSSYPSFPTTDWTHYTKIGIAQTDTSANLRLGIWSRLNNKITFEYNSIIYYTTLYGGIPGATTWTAASTYSEYLLPWGTASSYTTSRPIKAPVDSYVNLDVRFNSTVASGYDYINYGNNSSITYPTDRFNCRISFDTPTTIFIETLLNVTTEKAIFLKHTYTGFIYYHIREKSWEYYL